MLQERIQPQLEKIKDLSSKTQQQLNKQLDNATVEGRKVLLALGVDLNQEKSLNALVSSVKAHNPSPKVFLRNLDIATYDARFNLRWNSKMMTAFTKNEAIKTFRKEIKPKLDEMQIKAQDSLNAILEKANIRKTQSA